MVWTSTYSLAIALLHSSMKNEYKKTPNSGFFLRKDSAEVCVQCPKFSGSHQRDWFLYHLFQSTEESWRSLKAWGLLRTEKSRTACCCSRGPTVQQTDTRGSKRLQAPEKRNLQNLLLGICTHKTREDGCMCREKVWEDLRISIWTHWWRSSPAQRQSLKAGRYGCVFQSTGPDKVIRHMKETIPLGSTKGTK